MDPALEEVTRLAREVAERARGIADHLDGALAGSPSPGVRQRLLEAQRLNRELLGLLPTAAGDPERAPWGDLDVELIRSLAPLIRQTTEDGLARVNVALTAANPRELVRAVHFLAGGLAVLQIASINDPLKRLEDDLRAGGEAAGVEPFRARLELLEGRLRSLVAGLPS